MRYTFSLWTLLFSSPLWALVSIAPVDIGSKPGFSGDVSGSLSSKSGNTDKKEYTIGLRLQYDQGRDYLAWGSFTYDYGESAGVKNEDRLYGHVRGIVALDGNEWCGEAYVQSEQDDFKDIEERSLAGAGLRWRFYDSQTWGKGYAGLGGFAEKIDYAHPLLNPSEHNGRLNSYVAYTKKFPEGPKVSYVGYYQPKFGENSDYVTSQTAELIVPVFSRLSLSLVARYLYDSVPPLGVEKRDAEYTTHVVWEF